MIIRILFFNFNDLFMINNNYHTVIIIENNLHYQY